MWLKRNRTARAGHKVGGPKTSETLDINLYHIVVMCAKRHLDIAIILLSTALCFIDDADSGHSGLDVLDRFKMGSLDNLFHLKEQPKVTGR